MAYLDEIIAGLGEPNKTTEEHEGTQNAPEEKNVGNSKLKYSEEFWTRFSKATTATENNT